MAFGELMSWILLALGELIKLSSFGELINRSAFGELMMSSVFGELTSVSADRFEMSETVDGDEEVDFPK